MLTYRPGETLAHRLRRVYLPLFLVLLAAWFFHLTAYVAGKGWPASAAIGPVPGIVVTASVGAFYLGMLVVAYRPRKWHVNGEILSNDVSGWDYTEE